MRDEKPFSSWGFTEPGGFTSGIEGPATDADGNVYAVNYMISRRAARSATSGS